MTEGFEVLVDRRALCGQSPLWVSASESVWWVDPLRCELHGYRRDSETDGVVVLPEAVTGLAVRETGQMVAATESGFARVFPARPAVQRLADVDGGDRMNEGVCDHTGRFLAGTVVRDRQHPGAAVYALDGLRARLVVGGLGSCGGLGFSPDGATMYTVDSAARTVWAHDYDPDLGRADRPRAWVVCTPSEGEPAGLTLDRDGRVWVALLGTGRIHCYGPGGDLETVLWAPTPRITGLAFGGRALDEMYVTSGCAGCDESTLVSDPYAGALLRFAPGVTGLPAASWNGM